MSEVKGTRALELWCKRLVRDCPNVQIENMTTSWRNGMAFCALVHHFRPDLIDMSTLKPENIYENNLLAFSVAEKHLGVPALLDPEDMVENDVPDRLSVLTYLSQFYQRLGHTVNTKVSESDSKSTINAPDTSHPVAPIKFGKTGLDKCTACGLPVYLAQRLMVSQKLYHRRCFRCSKCSGHLNPKNYDVVEGSEFTCDSCKNEQNLLKYLNNNDCDQMGMVAYRDDLHNPKLEKLKDDIPNHKNVSRPSSVLEKINMFEKNSDKDTNIDTKVSNLSIRQNSSYKDLINSSGVHSETSAKVEQNMEEIEASPQIKTPEKTYKSNIDKFNFLQTQLSGDSINIDKTAEDIPPSDLKTKNEFELHEEVIKLKPDIDICAHEIEEEYKSNSNITDDSRIRQIPQNDNESSDKIPLDESTNEVTTELKVPPRRKKLAASEKLNSSKDDKNPKLEVKEYPDHLNPFGTDDEDEKEDTKTIKAPNLSATKVSTNPFGSSDEEDDEVPPIQPLTKPPSVEKNTPMRRVIAVNPFWSDGEEPSSDEDVQNSSSKSTYSSLTASTPNLMSSTPKRRKPKAPPPPVITITESLNATSMDDVASISSFSSYNSTVHSDQKSYEKSTPTFKKKRPAPTPPESICNLSGCSSLEKGVDASSLKNASGSEGIGRRTKGPAPGLPLPERREVKLQMSPEELQVQLDLLETQQLGLERQGVLIERMIRDKCEGDEACTAPQEEVEDLVIQLCELVNEKNDLFRKQTELMYIRRQQRLEQEQADIEHEIRIIQSRPAVNRIDADKVREEQLVSRLVEIVLMRDELVQQIDAERRRERQEDLAIAASIASKRAQRNSADSNNSLKADVSNTHKKSKVKDKVKKQLKKAKHTLISKKKEDSPEKKEKKEKEGKEAKNEKENKSK